MFRGRTAKPFGHMFRYLNYKSAVRRGTEGGGLAVAKTVASSTTYNMGTGKYTGTAKLKELKDLKAAASKESMVRSFDSQDSDGSDDPEMVLVREAGVI